MAEQSAETVGERLPHFYGMTCAIRRCAGTTKGHSGRWAAGGRTNMKQISLRIYPDGKVQAETHGIKGRACLDYISIIEQLTGARTVDSDFTAEYREAEEQLTLAQETEVQA